MDLFESEINWLREELNKHNYNYYVCLTSLLSVTKNMTT